MLQESKYTSKCVLTQLSVSKMCKDQRLLWIGLQLCGFSLGKMVDIVEKNTIKHNVRGEYTDIVCTNITLLTFLNICILY